jgi:hypothetical protein
MFTSGGGHLIVDVLGWFTGPGAAEATSGLFVPSVAPSRLLDTRSTGPVWPRGSIAIAIPGVNAAVGAVAANVTMVDAMAPGFVTAHAARTPRPPTSTVNAASPGDIAAGFVTTRISPAGLGIYGHAGTDVVVDLAGWFLGEPAVITEPPPVNSRPATCATDVGSGGLTDFFAGRVPFLGEDYQRTVGLPDGRVLWFFQDVFAQSRTGYRFVHNAALVQSGRCFTPLLSGTWAEPREYLAPDGHTARRRWFWPMGGGIGRDGNVHVFVAEMIERGPKYLSNSEPVATWRATIRLPDLTVTSFVPAANPSAELYGWSVTSDENYSYLYAYCNRQFGWKPMPYTNPVVYTHDWSCTADVTVSRVAKGAFATRPEYWNGRGWTADAGAAVPVIPREGRSINPTQVMFDGRRFVAVTKEGDWWGTAVYIDTAPAAQGPWTTRTVLRAQPLCADCTTYFASFVPYREGTDRLIVGLSNNTWDGSPGRYYRPTFFSVRVS